MAGLSRILSRAVAIVSALLLGVASVPPAAAQGLEPGTYRIGYIASQTGALGFAGVSYFRGASLATDELNAAATIGNGVKIELAAKEAAEDPARSIQAFNQFASDPSVVAITCCILTPVAGALRAVSISKRTPLVIYGATSGGLPELPYVYNVSTLPLAQEQALARYVVQAMKPRSMLYFVTADNDAFINRMKDTRDIFAAAGTKVAGVISVLSADTDFAAAATQAVALNPDLIEVYTTGGPAVGIIAALRAREYKGQIVANGAISPAPMWQRAGPALVGVPFPLNFSPELSDTPEAKAFIKAFESRYGTPPDLYAAAAYSAIYFIAQGLSQVSGKPTRDALAESLSKITSLKHNVYGGLGFTNGQGETAKTMFAAWTGQGKIAAWKAPP